MSDDDDAPPRPGPVVGRTWADVTVGGGWLFVVLVLVALLLWRGATVWAWFASVPLWICSASVLTLLWLPWLFRIATESSDLLLVTEGGLVVSEWRLGRRVPLTIEGEPLTLTSRSGTRRLLVTEFDPDRLVAVGSALAGATVFDLARDLAAFDRLARQFEAVLREDRLTREMVGVEVERRMGDASDQWLRLLYGLLDLSELEEALGSTRTVLDVEGADSPDLPSDSVGVDP